jgi:pSer/pThr/pTyr-binding forkhead associated (FHA) protein
MSKPAVPSPNELTTTISLASLRPVSTHHASLDSLTDEEREIVSQLPEGSAMLIVLAGPGKGSRFLLGVAETTIGRDTQSDIFLDDITVSRKHAVVEHSIGSTYQVRDLDSLNGTYVNGVALRELSLTQGDEIQIGKFKLTFFVKDGNVNDSNVKEGVA